MKTIVFAVAVSLFVAFSARAEDNAVITGKITLTGTPPPESAIDLDGTPDCKKLHAAALKTRRYIVGAGGELANCFVYIKDGLAKQYAAPAQAAKLDQKACLYVPYVLGVQLGQDIDISNSDTFLHNVHYIGLQKEENFAQLGGKKDVRKFAKPEIMVKFKCDVHPWMFAYVGVVAHPFYAVTNEKGQFKISGLPAGKYTVEVWHLKAGVTTATVEVKEGATVTQDFTLKVPEGK